jgi:AcrR family transcriptional regulator
VPGSGSWPAIAKILGVSVGTLYNHIPNLKELRNSRVSRQLEGSK